MATTQTTELQLYKPEVGGEADTWGTLLNTNMDAIDTHAASVNTTLAGLGTAATQADTRYAHRSNNLSDLQSASSARTNLGLGTAAVEADTKYAHRGNNLGDLTNQATARTNLGLGTAAVQADTRYAHRANNLSDLSNLATARTNLGADNAANLTTGTLPGERLPAVTTSVSVAGSGDFTGGTLQFTQTGKLVNIQNTTNLTHATGSGPTSATTLIPSGLRPERPVSFVVSFSNSGLTRITISQGLLMLQYRDWSGAGRNETSFSENLNYTYRVA